MAYGNTEVLENQFESMKKRVDYTTRYTKEENLWIGGVHYGDWLALDAEVVIDGVRYEVKAGTYCWKH